MSVRGGGNPRRVGSQAHPIEDRGGHHDDPLEPVVGRPAARDRYPGGANGRRSGRNGGSHRIRSTLFVLGLGAVVLVGLFVVVRPLAVATVGEWAVGNPTTWRLPILGDLVASRLADQLAAAPSSDPTPVEWTVVHGDTVASVADRLEHDGFIASRPAFLYAAYEQDLAGKLTAGSFRLRRDMTPPEVVRALIEDRVVIQTVDVTFREGLRIEQMTAKLETIHSAVDPKAFYDLAMHPPASLLADYPWLKLPKGASLEGFLYPATYTLRVDSTTAEQLIRLMLDTFDKRVGPTLMDVPSSRGLDFYQIVCLASIVRMEAKLDEERPIIAGVYQNRLDTPPRLLDADPTVIYANDTMQLAKIPIEAWQTYSFWNLPSVPMAKVQVDQALQGFQTYQQPGLIPSPIVSPTVADIEAALHPDTSTGYRYFVLIPGSGGQHAFAKTYAEHLANLKKYGYN